MNRIGLALRNADYRVYQTASSTYGLVNHERKSRSGLPLARKLGMWRRGFFAESATIYDLPRNDPGEYLSDYQHFVRCSRINAWEGFFQHKLVLRSFLLAMGFRQPHTVALLLDRRIQIDPFDGKARYVRSEDLLELLRGDGRDREFIVKPEDGLCGEDLFLLAQRGGEFFRQRGRDVERFDLTAFLGEQENRHTGPRTSATLIEERMQQGPFWAGLFPDSANTIHALTLWIPGERAPFIARAVQRIGTADTVPTDNWSGGGISVPIDPTSGLLGVGRTHPLRGRRKEHPFEQHPDTGAQLTGGGVPGWNGIADTVLRAAGSLPFNRMGGWDVLVDDSGTPILLEANGYSDVNLLQVHGGLFAEPRIRRFYQAFGVV